MSILSDKKRLVLEHAAMRERWGDGARWCCDKSRTKFWWEYDVHVEGNHFPIHVVYPSDYPSSPPDIIIKAQLPKGTPHVLPRRRMCWYYPGETKRNRNVWNPSRDTAALCIGVAHRWFIAFLVWQATDEWPVPDAVSA
ncbi:MAG: hypothetical protein KJ749_13060 [Planctomycetes bacterium]|nr:hypothetical protein [Planctomycetota bacterium]